MDVWFEGLSYATALSKRALIDNVSGRFIPGELTGILGPSGAGKTTLLNALSGLKTTGVTGEIAPGIKQSSCYISQEDLLAPMVTAGELMEFASCLKLPGTTLKRRTVIVDQILNSLSLRDCYHTRTERLSGGQRRRLSIAVELISNPSVLLLDEPTSGLDTVSAGQLIRLLRALSQEGRTVVCTIHQPSALLFDLFDRVYFLAYGKCVYQGGPGPHLIRYLEANEFYCPKYYNPADFIIELIEDRMNAEALSSASNNGRNLWYSKELESSSNKSSAQSLNNHKLLPDAFRTKETTKRQASFWLQFCVLFNRLMLQANRNKIGLYIQVFHPLLCGIGIGALFIDNANDGAQPFNQLKFHMTLVVYYVYTYAMISILQYPFEIKLVKQEYFNKWYSLFPYYMAYAAAKAVYMVPLVFIFVVIVYGFSGLPWEFTRFVLFFIIGVLTSSTSEAYGLFIGSIFSVTNGSMIGPMSLAPIYIFAIYGMDFSRHIGPFMNALVHTSFMRVARTCQLLIGLGLDRGPIFCPLESDLCLFSDPKIYLYHLNLENTSIWFALGDLLLYALFYRLLFFLALKWKLRT